MTDPPTDRPPGSGEPQLTDADMRVLDFLAEHGFDASRVELLPEADRPRAMALIRQMQVLDHYPAGSSNDTLVDATLARIDRWEAASAESLRFEPRRIGAFRLADLIGVAAVLMIGTAVLVPIARSMRSEGLARACASNMRTLGGAIASYASQHGGMLPATASIADLGSMFRRSRAPAVPAAQANGMAAAPAPAGRMEAVGAPMQFEMRTPDSWMRVSVQVVQWHSIRHSENLNPLVAGRFCGAQDLQCPGCASGTPCFAYRVPMRGERFMLDSGRRSVLLADANPLTEANRVGTRASHLQGSNNHAQSGQNMLFNDGSAEWHTSPLLPDGLGGFDNIWLPRDSQGRERIDMRAWPTVPHDNFVTQ